MAERDNGCGDGYLAARLEAQAERVTLSTTPPFPRVVMFELSNACNHACTFCYNPAMRRGRGRVDAAFVRRILAEAHALGAREAGFATTGEPLVDHRLFDHVEAAKRLGYEYAYFSTNGALLDARKVERIFSSGLDSIKFSINAGTAATYAATHKHDCFDHVIAMVRLIDRRRRELDRPLKLLVTSILTRENAGEQDRLRALIGDVVDDLAFYEDTQAVGPTNGSNAPLPCAMVFNRVHVTCEGYLTACCVDYENNLVTADLNRTSLAEAWHGAAHRELRRRHLQDDLDGTLCRVCVSRRMSPYEPLTDIGRPGAAALMPAAAGGAAGADRRDVVALFTTSLGEIEWLLPVLTRLKRTAPAVNVWAIVAEPQLQQKLALSGFLHERLAAVATVLLEGRDRLEDHAMPERVGLLLKTDDPDGEVSRRYRRLLPGARVVVYPSGTALLTRRDDSAAVVEAYFAAVARATGADPRDDYLPCDLVLAGSPHMVPFYRGTARAADIRALGVPRYDPWWVRVQLSDPTLAASEEAAFAARHAQSALFIIRGPHWLYQDAADYRYLMGTVLAELQRRPGLGLIIKPHPRQDVDEIRDLAAAIGCDRLLVSYRPLPQLAHLVDLTLSMFSSGVLDSLSVGTPVAEYFRYHDRAPVLEFRPGRDGTMISIYESLGLVENLRTRENLSRFLDAFFGEGRHRDLAARRREAFRSACAVGADSSAAAADLLLTMLSPTGARELAHA